MSGIAKPTVKSSTSTTPTQLINVEEIASMDKIIFQTDPNGVVPGVAAILFSMKPYARQSSIMLKYPGSLSASTTLRDASYAAIETLIAATTV